VRVVFLGNAAWSVASLQTLAASSHEISLVLTRAPRPAGRGNRPAPTPVAQAARALGLPLKEVETVKSGRGFEALAGAAPDVLAVVAYGEILPKAVLDLPSAAPINVHFSLLPQLRGAAPVHRAILEGLDVTGVTTIRMDEGTDTGPVLVQAEEAISPDDDAGSLGARLATLGGRLLVDTLDRLEAGSLVGQPQDETKATNAPKLKLEDRVLDWSQPAESIARQVRALAPDPGATTTFRGKGLNILRATSPERPHTEPVPEALGPGEVVGAVVRGPEKGFYVLSGDGVLRLDEVQPEGRRRMSGAEFARGYRPEIGERLG
jgi:methionyl-tRNA formyltransferase